MTRYEIGDIECSTVAGQSGKFRAHVRVAGIRLHPAQSDDYIYVSADLFDDATLALQHAKDHANEKFPPG